MRGGSQVSPACSLARSAALLRWRCISGRRLVARRRHVSAAQHARAVSSPPPRVQSTSNVNGFLAMNVAAVLQGGVVRVLRRVFNSAEDSSSGPEDASEALSPADFSFRCGVLWPCFRRR